MKVLWFTLFFLLPNHLVGQYTFEKIISPAGGAYPMAGCLLSNGHYAFLGANFTAGSYGFSLLTINELGDTILTKKFQFGNLQTIPSSIREGQYGHMIISGYLKNPVTPYDRNAIHIITDSLGEAISIKRIQISSDTQGQDAFHTADGGLVMKKAIQYFSEASTMMKDYSFHHELAVTYQLAGSEAKSVTEYQIALDLFNETQAPYH